jgi:hypothetical protein
VTYLALHRFVKRRRVEPTATVIPG